MLPKDARSCIQTIELPRKLAFNVHGVMDVVDADNCRLMITLLEMLENGAQIMQWIPVKWHEMSDEERIESGFPKDVAVYIDNIMPNDNEDILITVKERNGNYHIEMDVCMIDEGFYLDSGYDWVDDIVARMPLPEAWKEGKDE